MWRNNDETKIMTKQLALTALCVKQNQTDMRLCVLTFGCTHDSQSIVHKDKYINVVVIR